jgi:hypothetical protein
MEVERYVFNQVFEGNGICVEEVVRQKTILIESLPIVNWWRHLVKTNQMWEEGKRFLYLDHSWTENKLTIYRCWQKRNDGRGVMA